MTTASHQHESVSTLADLAIQPQRDTEATLIAVDLLDSFYRAANATLDTTNMPTIAFRNAPLLRALETLNARKDNLSADEAEQLAILTKSVELQTDLLLDGSAGIAIVMPDSHHWDFPATGQNNTYAYVPSPKIPLIVAMPELHYAGILSNPYDPTKTEFGAEFAQDPQRMATQAHVIATVTGLDSDRLLQTVFVNAAQVMGRRLVNGTSVGQAAPAYWVGIAKAAQSAMDITPR